MAPSMMTWLMSCGSHNDLEITRAPRLSRSRPTARSEIMQDLLRRARQEDFLGEGTPREMLVFYSKDQLPDCVALLHGFAESVETLGQIESPWDSRISSCLGRTTHPSRICASTRRLGGEG